MRRIEVDDVVLSRTIDNSGVVREVDPRSRRDLVAMLLLVAVLVGGLVLYAWPHFQMRQIATETERLQREKERLIEENRKLRLEKASLENLERVEAIARRDLGLERPSPDRLVVVEAQEAPTGGARLASGRAPSGGARN
jgi:cell division protein FtsL